MGKITTDLVERYGGQMFVPDLSQELGIRPKTIHNQISDGRFPVTTIKIGAKRAASTRNVGAYLESLEHDENAVTPPQHGRRATRKAARKVARTLEAMRTEMGAAPETVAREMATEDDARGTP